MNQWLFSPIPHDSEYYIKDVLQELLDEIIHFIDSTPILECEYEELTFKLKFYQYIYHNYVNQYENNFKPYDDELYDYFSIKFSQDIIDIFIRFKDITKRYNLDLFHGRQDISLNIEEFLFDHLLIEDPYYDDLDSENNIDCIIDE